MFVITSSLVFLLMYFGLFNTAAHRSTDFLFSAQPSKSSFIDIVAIDEASLDAVGPWPWPEATIRRLLETLDLGDARVIGYLPQEEATGKVFLGLDAVVNTAAANQPNIISDRDGFVRTMVCPDSFALALTQRLRDIVCPKGTNHINYSLDTDGVELLPAVDVLMGRIAPTHEVVLVGLTVPSATEMRQTPLSNNPLPGVLIQANIVESMLAGSMLREIPREIRISASLALLAIYYLALRKWGYVKGLVLAGVMIGADFFGVIFLYHRNWLYDFFYLPAGLLTTYITQLSFGFIYEQRSKNYIREAFGKYLNNEVVEQLIKHHDKLKLGGERKTTTLLFADLQSFTSLAETMEPDETVSLLNSFLALACDHVEATGGTLDKFIGDEVVAFWNAPLDQKNHASRAATTALAIRKDLPALADLSVGMGLNTGEAFVGNIGSPERFDYTVIGDVVNTTERLEGLTRYYKVDIVITKSFVKALEAAGDGDLFVYRKLDRVVVKGKTRPVEIYELIGPSSEISPKTKECIEKYEEALGLYRLGFFRQAATKFKRVAAKYDDPPSRVMAKRCEKLARRKTKDWLGVYSAATGEAY